VTLNLILSSRLLVAFGRRDPTSRSESRWPGEALPSLATVSTDPEVGLARECPSRRRVQRRCLAVLLARGCLATARVNRRKNRVQKRYDPLSLDPTDDDDSSIVDERLTGGVGLESLVDRFGEFDGFQGLVLDADLGQSILAELLTAGVFGLGVAV